MSSNDQPVRTRVLAWLLGLGVAACLVSVPAGPASPATAAETPAAVGAAAAAPSSPADEPTWWGYDRRASFGVVKSKIKVPTRDGTRIGCQMYRPGRNGEVAPGRFPVIVWEFTPYTALKTPDTVLLAGLPGFQSAASVPIYAEYFARHGYAVAVCDVRGTGTSGGEFTYWFPKVEARDNYDVIEWLARRPWSTGRVGQAGSSYGSVTTQRVAALRPPHLEAIVPQLAIANVYDFIYPGGIRSENAESWASLTSAVSYGRVDPVKNLQNFDAHPLYDAFWRQMDINRVLDQIRVPTLLYGGWQDIVTAGTVESFLGRSSRTWLIMGPGQHNAAHIEPHAPVPLGAQLAWWDHWLKRSKTAPLPTARVTSFEMPLASGDGWQEFSAWPPANVRSQRMYLRADRQLAGGPGRPGVTSYQVNPLDGPARTFAGIFYYPEDDISDQRLADTLRLHYTTPALSSSAVIAGQAHVRLRAALSSAKGQFVVKIEDVAPDGSVTPVTDGYLNASHRTGDAREVAVVPGQFRNYRVAVSPTHWRFEQGHRIRVVITSGDVPLLPPTAPLGTTVTIASGPDASWIDLPLRRNGR